MDLERILSLISELEEVLSMFTDESAADSFNTPSSFFPPLSWKCIPKLVASTTIAT